MARAQFASEHGADGSWQRQDSAFRDRVDVLADPGRYHLYVAPACPWSHRVMIVREVLGKVRIRHHTKMAAGHQAGDSPETARS